MQKNITLSKIGKKRNKPLEINESISNVLYLLDKCLKLRLHKMLECQTTIHVPTFMLVLLFQAYCKQYMVEIGKSITMLTLTKKKTCLQKKGKIFSSSSTHTNILIWKYVNKQIS